MTYTFSELNEEVLRKLYSEYGFRAKEIGVIAGLTESSILLKLKKYGIPVNPRGIIRKEISIQYEGKDRSLKKGLTKDLLKNMYEKGLTDEAIGKLFNMTGEGVAYRRKKYGLCLDQKMSSYKKAQDFLKGTSTDILKEDYYALTTQEFSNKYEISKTAWLPYLRSLGVLNKHEHRINKYPPLTLDQKRVLIAGMLGDGGISDGCYYEFHSKKQLQYLKRKKNILSPYSKEIKETTTGYEFETVSHPVFREYKALFYKEGLKGKLIPLDFLSEFWDDSILAYWFFDDGSFDDEEGSALFTNFCPIKEQREALTAFLNEKYPWKFSCFKAGIYLSKKDATDFGKLLIRYATPDLYYKIPEVYLTPAMVSGIKLDDIALIRSKFYRTCEDIELRKKMEETIFSYYRQHGFPYMSHTEDRLNYLIDEFIKFQPKCASGIIAHNSAGQNLCEQFFPNIYECYRKGFDSPYDQWEKDDFLRKLIKNRLRYADRLTDASMRTGIKLTKACVSNFKPAVAKYLYSQYGFNGKILDYSCGFGSRMLGAMSLGMEYNGFEPAEKTYNNLISFGEFLKRRTRGKYEIRKTGSEIEPFRKNYYGFAFSSPPYFDYEQYSKDPGQSLVQYPEYEEWLEGYWFKTIQNCYESLVDDGFFGVCLSSATLGDILERTISYAKEIGFYFHKDFIIPFKHVLSGGDKSETVLIFSKSPKFPEAKPVFYGKHPIKKYTEVMDDGLTTVLSVKKKRYSQKEIISAVLKFKEIGPVKGVSRDAYQDGSLGVPPHVLEHKYGSWNYFIKSCGFLPCYEAFSAKEHIKNYLEVCHENNKILSFFEYEKITGKPSTRLKRLFYKDKPYSSFYERLKEVALKKDLWEKFIEEIKE